MNKRRKGWYKRLRRKRRMQRWAERLARFAAILRDKFPQRSMYRDPWVAAGEP